MTTVQYIIRPPVTGQEWEAVKRLLLDYRKEFNDDTCFTSFEEELSDIENLYKQEGKLKLIAVSELDGTVVGCVGFRTLSPETVEMKRLYVDPAHRGKQLGRKLAETIISRAVEQGYQKMILDTMNEMKAAQQLYRDLGFVTIPAYNDQDPSKVVCYGKNLT